MIVDSRRRATVNLIASTVEDDRAATDEVLRGLGDYLASIGAPVRWVSPSGPSPAGTGMEAAAWSEAEPLAVSPHDACACADEGGASRARGLRRAIGGPAFVYLALGLDYMQRYGAVAAAPSRPEHWPIASAALGRAMPGGVRPDAAVLHWPVPASDPDQLWARLAGKERTLGLMIAGEPDAALLALGLEAVRAARERGAFAGYHWRFDRVRPGQARAALFDGAGSDTTGSAGLDICLRLGEGRPGLSADQLMATGCIVVGERADPSGPWPPGRPVFADLVRRLEAALPRVEDLEGRQAAAAVAREGLPTNWRAAFAPHAELLRRALARTLAANRRTGAATSSR